jgi:hypothetical protein
VAYHDVVGGVALPDALVGPRAKEEPVPLELDVLPPLGGEAVGVEAVRLGEALQQTGAGERGPAQHRHCRSATRAAAGRTQEQARPAGGGVTQPNRVGRLERPLCIKASVRGKRQGWSACWLFWWAIVGHLEGGVEDGGEDDGALGDGVGGRERVGHRRYVRDHGGGGPEAQHLQRHLLRVLHLG